MIKGFMIKQHKDNCLKMKKIKKIYKKISYNNKLIPIIFNKNLYRQKCNYKMFINDQFYRNIF